jgi:hypothetical protein
MFVVARALCYPQRPNETEDTMRELRSEVTYDRRVRLVVDQDGRYAVTLEVLGPEGAWEDISLAADQALDLHTASLCYRLRRVEQQARTIVWKCE